MTTRTRHPRSDEASIDLSDRLARPRPVPAPVAPREDAAVVREALARPIDREFAERLRYAVLEAEVAERLGRL